MKSIRLGLLPICLLVFASSTAYSAVLYEDTFSGTVSGWFRHTHKAPPGFSMATDPVNETVEHASYGRYNISVPTYTAESDSSTRWRTGLSTSLNSVAELPDEWRLSFDVSLPAAEPFPVSFIIRNDTSPPPFDPVPGSRLQTYWVHPVSPGWQTITVDHQTPYVTEESIAILPRPLVLQIALASHDATGNPLTIFEPGEYHFLIDNIRLETVPEPTGLGTLAFGLVGVVCWRRFRNLVR